jgi:hypothetical protein
MYEILIESPPRQPLGLSGSWPLAPNSIDQQAPVNYSRKLAIAKLSTNACHRRNCPCIAVGCSVVNKLSQRNMSCISNSSYVQCIMDHFSPGKQPSVSRSRVLVWYALGGKFQVQAICTRGFILGRVCACSSVDTLVGLTPPMYAPRLRDRCQDTTHNG